MVLGELSESIRKLIDSWRVMRVMTLAYNVLSKRFPVSGWELDLVVRLYQAYAVSRYKDVFTPFAIEEWRKAFDHIFKLSISTGMSCLRAFLIIRRRASLCGRIFRYFIRLLMRFMEAGMLLVSLRDMSRRGGLRIPIRV